jgi:hypothetical protein
VADVARELLLISEAVARLEKGMFGGPISRPEPVRKLKEEAPRFSVGFGPQRERAAAVILSAMLEGDLLVHVLTRPTGEGARRSIVVPVDVLQRMPTARDGLPDHPVRHPVAFLRNYPVAEDLFAALSTSALHVKRTEFEAWYKKQKGLRRWPSQRTSNKPRTGRPSKQTEPLFNWIRALMAEEKWSASDGIARLEKLLASKGAPPRNTLSRAVDQLFVETGDPSYRIRKRARRPPGSPHT